MRETLRISGPASEIIPRVVAKDCILGDNFRIYKGDLISVPVGLGHFRKD
jgi:cytochrome P450